MQKVTNFSEVNVNKFMIQTSDRRVWSFYADHYEITNDGYLHVYRATGENAREEVFSAAAGHWTWARNLGPDREVWNRRRAS